MDENYESVRAAQEIWPQPLSDPKQLYRNIYDLMHKASHNIVCACCGIIGHDIDEFSLVSTNNKMLAPLAVNPATVPFLFDCRITAIDQHHIMIDPLAIKDQNTISICNNCYSQLSSGSLPAKALANFRWIGPVPEELKDLTWVEEAFVARSHLFGRVFRLEQSEAWRANIFITQRTYRIGPTEHHEALRYSTNVTRFAG